MNNNQNQFRNKGVTIPDIERQIKNYEFKSKNELAGHLIELRKKGFLNVEDSKIRELLDLYDNQFKSMDPSLDMSDYSAASLEKEDIIISENQDRILETTEGIEGYEDEFKKTQNVIISHNNEKNVGADDVFEKMANQEKEELELISFFEAFTHPNISAELLMKIKFFITNVKVNPNIFKINMETGIIYNQENKEPYEIKKNEANQTYEIYRNNEKIYEGSIKDEEEEKKEQEEERRAFEEQQLENEQYQQEETLNKPKVKVRKLETSNQYPRNAAFTKIGFLMMSIITFVLLTLMTLLLMK